VNQEQSSPNPPSSKAVNQLTSLVPEIVFDIIGRLIPGILVLANRMVFAATVRRVFGIRTVCYVDTLVTLES